MKTEETNDITLYIQGHGQRLTDTHIPIDESSHCEIISFTGSIGKSGIMKRTCPGIIIPETDDLPEIRIDGAQLDVMALSYVEQVYKHIDSNTEFNTTEKSEISFAIIENNIKQIYDNCDVYTFPYSKRTKTQITSDSFTIIQPLHDKKYQLHPNEHEDCRNRKECSISGCELLDKSEQLCPYYGIYVIYSTNQQDKQHTLTGINPEVDIPLIANLNSEESHDVENTTFWRNKIIQRWENIISSEMNEVKKGVLEDDMKHIQHYLFMRFSALSAEEFMTLAKKILKGDPDGQRIIQRMVDDIVKELKEQDYKEAMGDEDEDEGYDDVDLSDLGL
jgi:hypothetical protein